MLLKVIFDIITKRFRNTIKIGIELIYTCIMLSNVEAIEFNGGAS